MVTVVQLVERQIVILVVVGSSPIGHPIFIPHLYNIKDNRESGGIGRRAGFRYQYLLM